MNFFNHRGERGKHRGTQCFSVFISLFTVNYHLSSIFNHRGNGVPIAIGSKPQTANSLAFSLFSTKNNLRHLQVFLLCFIKQNIFNRVGLYAGIAQVHGQAHVSQQLCQSSGTAMFVYHLF